MLHNRFYIFVYRDTKPNFHSSDNNAFADTRPKSVIRAPDPTAPIRPRSSSPCGKPASNLTLQRTPSSALSVSPLNKRRKGEVGQPGPTARVSVPTILVEDEPVEEEGGTSVKNTGTSAERKEGRVVQTKTDPGSPDKGKTATTLGQNF